MNYHVSVSITSFKKECYSNLFLVYHSLLYMVKINFLFLISFLKQTLILLLINLFLTMIHFINRVTIFLLYCIFSIIHHDQRSFNLILFMFNYTCTQIPKIIFNATLTHLLK